MLALIRRYSHVNWALADQAVVSSANFLTGILVARFAGIEEYGVYVLAWVVLEIVHSFQDSLIILPMMSIGPKHADAEKPAFFGAVIVQQVGFLVLSTVVSLLGAWLAILWFPEWRTIAATFVGLQAISQSQHFVRRYFFARSRPLTAFVSDVIRYVSQVAGLFVLGSLVAMDAVEALWVHAATAAAGTAFAVCFMRELTWDRQVLAVTVRRHWAFAKWMILTQLMRLMTGNLYIMLAGMLLGTTAVGAVRATQNLVGACHIIQLGLENIVPVRAASHLRDGQKAALRAYLKRFAIYGGLAIGAVVLVAAAAPEFWMSTLYGDEYRGYGYLVQWWAVLYLLAFFIRPVAIGLRTLERTQAIFSVQLTSTIFAAITSYPLTYYLEIPGVMSGLTALAIIQLVMTYVRFQRSISE